MNQLPPSYPEQLCCFIRHTVLPAARPALWWTLGLVFFSALNLVFAKEVWLHTPQATHVFGLLLLGSLVVSVWVAAATAKQISRAGIGGWWQLLWKLVAIAGYTGAVLLFIPYAIWLFVLLA